jgi:RNA polymerase sigma-70 factor (ECF subfamily)
MTYPENEIVQLFKTEYSNLVAVLCRFYGIENIQLAQDIVSDTFLKAMKTWSHNGMPDKPKTWLRRVAVNQLKDHFRRDKVFREKVQPEFYNSIDNDINAPFSEELINDSQLRMMFVICHSELKKEEHICVSLRLLCGFSVNEIAKALLTSKDAINKKLYRAKQKLKKHRDSFRDLKKSEYSDRIDSILRILYLLFNEGYYSNNIEKDIQSGLCWEALKLSLFLSQQSFLPHSKIYALISLMSFQASRLEARKSKDGQFILFEQQDKSLWNKDLIKKGEEYLSLSAKGTTVSKYHLEAAIAYWHTTNKSEKWDNILQLYNRLLTIEYSPIIAMNRTYALAKANSVDDALIEAQKLNLSENHFYYCLMAELYKMKGNMEKELDFLKLALQYAEKENELTLIQTKIEGLQRTLYMKS